MANLKHSTPLGKSRATATGARASSIRRFLPILLLAAGCAAFFALGGREYISINALADNRDALKAWTAEAPFRAAGAYVFLYIAGTALSLPIGTLLTLAGGFVFGTWLGGALTAVGATAGATLLFIAAKTAFADYFQAKIGGLARRMRDRFAQNAFSYILALRLAPVFPFVVVNVAPALAGASLRAFVAATALGILPGTFVYASVGAGLDSIFNAGGAPDLSAVLHAKVLIPLILLALLALAPAVWKQMQRRRER